jgi:hypothetical protein
METVKKSYEELLTLIQLLNLSITDGKTIGEKKLTVFAKKLQPFLDEYNEKLEDIRLDNASVDKDKNLLLNEKGGYMYTAEATKKVSKEIKELLKEEFDFSIVPVRQNIDLEKYTFLKGWVSGLNFEEKEEEEIEL